jgi:hypothetical protein
MKNLIVAIAILATPFVVNAGCFGSEAFKTCTDDSGNTYNVQKFGGTTNVQGTNSQTGSAWSQTSNTFGNTTQTYGNAANGSTWNSTTIASPGMTQQFGTDSKGDSFNKTCTQAGCF